MSPLLCHVADLHITDRSGESGATLSEQVDICKWIGTDAASAGASVMLVAGDVFDRASTPAERNAAIEVFLAWSEMMPVVVVRGNHDRPGELAFLGKLKSHFPIYVRERPDVIDVGDCTVACLPWPSKASVVEFYGTDSTTETANRAGAALAMLLHGFTAQFVKGRTSVLLAHAELHGASMDSGQPLGPEADLPLAAGDLIDTGADYIALGHIHRHQIIDGRICYAGAVRQTNFGEDGRKGYCLVDVQPGLKPHIEHRQGPGHSLVTLDYHWGLDDMVEVGSQALVNDDGTRIDNIDDAQDVASSGDAIRIKYEVRSEDREAALAQAEKAKARWLALGMRSVKIDASTIATTRARSQEIRKAKTTADKMEALWSSNGGRPQRATEQIEKLNDIEREGTVK
jgi:DNA repair protein SbcD/Mre11